MNQQITVSTDVMTIFLVLSRRFKFLFQLLLKTCIYSRGMLDGRGLFLPDKEIFCSHTDYGKGG